MESKISYNNTIVDPFWYQLHVTNDPVTNVTAIILHTVYARGKTSASVALRFFLGYTLEPGAYDIDNDRLTMRSATGLENCKDAPALEARIPNGVIVAI